MESTTNGVDICASCGARGERLKYCGACGLVAYCNQDCQKRDRKNHKPMCKIAEEIPPESESLRLDPEERIDFDAPLQYAIKHLHHLQHVCISIDQSACLNLHNPLGEPDRPVKMNWKNLEELLRRRLLYSFELRMEECCEQYTRRFTDSGKIWQELQHQTQLQSLTLTYPVIEDPRYLDYLPRGLKFLALNSMILDAEALPRTWLDHDKAHLLTKIGSLSSLVSLTLDGGHLIDSDLEFLRSLSGLRCLNLAGQFGEDGAGNTGLSLTDKACQIIAECCPDLQQLELSYNRQVTATGVRDILTSCRHLRELRATATRITIDDLPNLLPSSSTLLLLSFGELLPKRSADTQSLLRAAIQSTGGRTLLMNDFGGLLQVSGLSEECQARADESMRLLEAASEKSSDWKIVNEWDWLYGQ